MQPLMAGHCNIGRDPGFTYRSNDVANIVGGYSNSLLVVQNHRDVGYDAFVNDQASWWKSKSLSYIFSSRWLDVIMRRPRQLLPIRQRCIIKTRVAFSRK